MTMSPSINYADQVLREEAERLAKLKEEASAVVSASVAYKNDKDEESLKSSIAKVNLKGEEDFPTLGKAKVTTPVWNNSTAIPPKPIVKVVSPTLGANSNSSSRFLLPVEHQRKDLSVAGSLNFTCARVMKDTETTIEVSVSSQTKGISFVVCGKAANIKLAKRQLWSLLAQNGAIEFEVPEECLRFIIGPSGKVLKEIECCCAVKVKIPRGEDWTGSIIVSGDFEGVAMARDKILSIVQERGNKASIQIEIERTLAPFLWNKEFSGLSQEELIESFPTVKINLFKTGEGAHLNLTGDKVQIESIQQLIEKSLINLRSSIKSVNTFVPKSLHRLLIGPKGAVLHQLEEETGCGIFVPSVREDPENQQVTIYGPEDKLLKGLSSLMEKVKGMSSEKVKIPEISFKLLQNVQKYRNEFKSFDSEVSFHFSPNSLIEIDGKKENVLNFIAKLQELLNELAVFKVQDTLEVDQEYLKHVIGRKGQNLQQIQKEFEVEILIEDDGIVSFIGKDGESVKKAKEHVNSILSSVVDLLAMTARIDSKYHGLLIGSKGSNLSSYHEKYPSVMINFISESNEVTFKGPKSEVEPCHNEMSSQAEKVRHEMIMSSYTQVIEVKDEKLLKSTRDCAFLTNFARQYDCKLIIDANSLTLQGCKKAVDQALPLLKEQLNLIQDRDSLTFSVDPQYHGVLIGSEGRNLKHLMQKYSVKVDFPRSVNAEGESADRSTEPSDDRGAVKSANQGAEGVPSSVIKIVGPKANITKARDELLDLLKYHLDHDKQEILQVPSKIVPSLIGKNGTVIDSIKIESDCKIDFLNDNENDEIKNIKLSGTIESILKGKNLLNELIKELKEQTEEKFEVSSPEFLKSFTSGNFKREYRKITLKFPSLTFYARDAFIKIKGKTDLVFEAKNELERLVKLIESNEIQKLELNLSNRVYGKILGVAGANIKELTNEFDCEIIVPRQGQDGPVILIGQSDKVKDLADRIRSYCTEERLFKFPSPAFKSLIMSELGNNETFFSEIEVKQHPHGILLIGDIENIENVKSRLLEEITKRKV